jgi:hypothetical protein
MQHHWIKHLLHDFEENPATQVKFHWFMMIFWIVNLLIGVALLVLAPHLWIAIGVFYVFALSIYANWDTDYGAVSAAQASLHSEYLVQEHNKQPVQVAVEKLPNDGD